MHIRRLDWSSCLCSPHLCFFISISFQFIVSLPPLLLLITAHTLLSQISHCLRQRSIALLYARVSRWHFGHVQLLVSEINYHLVFEVTVPYTHLRKYLALSDSPTIQSLWIFDRPCILPPPQLRAYHLVSCLRQIIVKISGYVYKWAECLVYLGWSDGRIKNQGSGGI